MGNRFRNYLILRKIHKYFLNFIYVITSAIKLENITTPKSKFLRMIYFFCLKENLIFYISFDNIKFYINSSDKVNSRKIYSNLKFPQFDEFLRAYQLLESINYKTETLVDIGAHYGNISVPAVKKELFDRAVAIEPVSDNFDILEKNVNINDVTEKIRILNLFISDGDGDDKTEIYTFNNNPAASLKVDDPNFLEKYSKTYNLKNSKKIIVDQKKLDDILLEKTLDSTFIWSYCQGDDINIISSSKKVIKSNTPFSIPVSNYLLNKNKYDIEKFISQLIDGNYKKFYDLNEKMPQSYDLNTTSFLNLYRKYGTSGGFTNVLFV